MGGNLRLPDDDMSSLGEMNLEEMFPKEAEECERLSGGPYRKRYTPIENILMVTPDMEAIVDERRASALAEDFAEERNYRDEKWDNFHPTPQDLVPFHVKMASAKDDYPPHPHFSSSPSGKAVTKTTYHLGGKEVRARAKTDL